MGHEQLSIEGNSTATTYDCRDDGIDADVFDDCLVNATLPRMSRYPQARSVLLLDNASVHAKLLIDAACLRHGVLVLFPTLLIRF